MGVRRLGPGFSGAEAMLLCSENLPTGLCIFVPSITFTLQCVLEPILSSIVTSVSSSVKWACRDAHSIYFLREIGEDKGELGKFSRWK